jgi:hypothetical protein
LTIEDAYSEIGTAVGGDREFISMMETNAQKHYGRGAQYTSGLRPSELKTKFQAMRLSEKGTGTSLLYNSAKFLA